MSDPALRIAQIAKTFPQLAPPCLVSAGGDGHTWRVDVALDPAWCTACEEERRGYAQALEQAVLRHLGLAVRVTIR